MKTVSIDIEIDAPPMAVWTLLTDLDGYPRWNPFIREASGTVAVGQRLTLKVSCSAERSLTFRPRILAAEPGAELRWRGKLLVTPGPFDGEHRFMLSPTRSGGTRLVQSECFTGLLVPFHSKLIARTHRTFGALNEALKARAESQVA